MTTLALVLVATVAGVAVALQGKFIGTMDRAAGTAAAVFITYGLGGMISAAVWLLRGAPVEGLRRIPWYAWTAGALGLVIVGGIGYAAPRLGLARTLVVTVAAQMLAALLIDQRLLEGRSVAGFLLTVAGVWLIVK